MEIGYAPIVQYRTIAVWVDEAMTMTQWYDGDDPMTR